MSEEADRQSVTNRFVTPASRSAATRLCPAARSLSAELCSANGVHNRQGGPSDEVAKSRNRTVLSLSATRCGVAHCGGGAISPSNPIARLVNCLAKWAAISLAEAANNAGHIKAGFEAWRLSGSYMNLSEMDSGSLGCAGWSQIDPNQPGLKRKPYYFRDLEKAPVMTKPITDKAEVAVEYPDKLYIGTFAHSARFDAHIDQTGISLTLEVPGPVEQRKSVRMHFHHALFADILRDLAKTVAAIPPDDLQHREMMRDSAKALYQALQSGSHKIKKSVAGAA